MPEEAMKDLVAAIRALQRDLAQAHKQNVGGIEHGNKGIDELSRKIDDLMGAFPNRDPDGHRVYHEEMIQLARARREFWQALRTSLAEKGIWALLLFVLGAVALSIKSRLIP